MTPLEIALTQEGVRELTGQNDGVPAERYNRGERLPWCASFALWCFDQAGQPMHASLKQWYEMRAVHALLDEMRRRGWMLGAEPPKPGDLIFLSERGKSDASASAGTGHVGIVAMVGENYVISIDGNWSNAVTRVQRARTDKTIVGYARPWGGA